MRQKVIKLYSPSLRMKSKRNEQKGNRKDSFPSWTGQVETNCKTMNVSRKDGESSKNDEKVLPA